MTTATTAKPTTRRGLRRTAAAEYVGVSPSKFDDLVADGRMPRPFRVDNCVIWDIQDLDSAFDVLKDGEAPAHDDWSDVA